MKEDKKVKLIFRSGFTVLVEPKFRFKVYGQEFIIHRRAEETRELKVVESSPAESGRYVCSHVKTGMAIRAEKTYRLAVVALIQTWLFLRGQGAEKIKACSQWAEVEKKRLDKKRNRVVRKIRSGSQDRGHGKLRV